MRDRHIIPPQVTPITRDELRRLQLAGGGEGGGTAGVTTFNGRTGSVSLNSADVTNALGFTPASAESLAISIIDLPLADPAEPLFRLLLPAAMVFSSIGANAGIAATNPSSLRIFKNGSANGTITFNGTSGVISFTSASYAGGDIFELYPPASLDVTLDRVSITLGVN